MFGWKIDSNTQRFSVFPTLIYVIDIPEVVEHLGDILSDVKWRMPDDDRSGSESFFVLDEHQHLKDLFTEKVNSAVSELEYTVPLKLTTSWFFRLKPGAKHPKPNARNPKPKTLRHPTPSRKCSPTSGTARWSWVVGRASLIVDY